MNIFIIYFTIPYLQAVLLEQKLSYPGMDHKYQKMGAGWGCNWLELFEAATFRQLGLTLFLEVLISLFSHYCWHLYTVLFPLLQFFFIIP